MIDEDRTFADFGYKSTDLLHFNDKKGWIVCDKCGKTRLLLLKATPNLCSSCARKGTHTGKDNSMYGIHRFGVESPHYGKTHTEEWKKRMSDRCKTLYTGEDNPNWRGGASFNGYCVKFNEGLKDVVREKYDRTCYMCGISEGCNTYESGKQIKLSVHHVDLNKNQGCEEHKWILIPVCIHCHASCHTQKMVNALKYMLLMEEYNGE